MLDEYLYSLPITHQHQNKILYQAEVIKQTLINYDAPRIAILGCGSGIDLSLVEDMILKSNAVIYINDQDKDVSISIQF
ncbi:hypothetical protein TUM19329_09750 [Legionella antarctica]|uniref:Uncharacterized protein n=1 Tax=Legionella antarctica TaxID=2708020 RepID=A0A6F8T1Q6_9GAMM|nr:hypothetical protein [Legionella antarctica]BCA94614.1 hypothetical protein TUM19329_09750 [Legionella antarctica]